MNRSVGYRPGHDIHDRNILTYHVRGEGAYPYESSSCRTGYNESEFSFMQDNGWGCRTGHAGRPNNTCVGDTIFITNMTLVPITVTDLWASLGICYTNYIIMVI